MRRQTIFGGLGAIFAAAMSMTLAGCGGDDDDVAPEAATPPATVTLGTQGQSSSGKIVSLMRAATAATGASMRISQIAGPPVALTSTSDTAATLIAPSVAAPTPLTFRLSSTDARDRTTLGEATVTIEPAKIDFAAVHKNLNNVVTVPAGYTATVIYRLGDSLDAATGAYANNGTDAGLSGRAGNHGDALYYYGLATAGNGRDDNNSRRGLLVMNQQNITQVYLHPNGPTGTQAGQTRPEAEALKEMEAHGVSIVEVTRAGDAGAWSYVQTGALDRRITQLTPMAIKGPVHGSTLVRTRFSPGGTDARGTINSCANGYTPWGTNLTCEENTAGYFRRPAAVDNPRRASKEVVGLTRYGVGGNGNYGWAGVVAADGFSTIYPAGTRRWRRASRAPRMTSATNPTRSVGWSRSIRTTCPPRPANAPRLATVVITKDDGGVVGL